MLFLKLSFEVEKITDRLGIVLKCCFMQASINVII